MRSTLRIATNVGLYMDAGDVDGDGDADLVVGGYSSWTPKAKELTVEQQQRVVAIRAELELLSKQLEALNQAATKLPDGCASRSQSRARRTKRRSGSPA